MNRPAPNPPTLPGFDYVSLLGRGGFADVFAYRDLALQRQVAVKVMLTGLDPAATQRFRDEANTMAQLSNHPSIVTIYRADVSADGRPYLVMENCPPPSLSKRMPLQVHEALDIAIHIASAVETAHQRGILHRDIKPANILFTEFGSPALTDFGIATSAAAQGADAFSLHWAPPEQIAGQPTGPSADVYSLGATLWAMLVGHSPVKLPGAANDEWAMLKRVKEQPAGRTGRADVPESLERILATALAKRPTDRFARVKDFAVALTQVQAELHLSTTPIIVPQIAVAPEASEDGGTGTELSPYLDVDPDQPAPGASFPQGRTKPVLQHGRGWSDDVGAVQLTGPGIPEVRALPAAPVAQPTRKKNTTYAAIAAAVLVAVGIGFGAWTLTRNATGSTEDAASTPAAQPVDPVGQQVPKVTNGTATKNADKVVFSWQNSGAKPGDAYLWRLQVPGEEQPVQKITEPTVTVPAQAGRTCVEVVLLRSSGRSSEPTVICTEG